MREDTSPKSRQKNEIINYLDIFWTPSPLQRLQIYAIFENHVKILQSNSVPNNGLLVKLFNNLFHCKLRY